MSRQFWISHTVSVGFVLLLVYQSYALAHGVGSLGVHTLEWHTDDVARVVVPASSFGNFGVSVLGEPGEVVEVEGRRCIRAAVVNVDVRDELAFDVDETVQLEIEFDLQSTEKQLTIAYDKSGSSPGIVAVELPERADQRFHVEKVSLARARFAGRGDFSTDFMIADVPDPLTFFPGPMTICALRVVASFATEQADTYGWLKLSVHDEHGQITPARLGLYDASGRTPLPSSSALEVEEFDDRTRMVLLRQEPGTARWPAANRWVFYSDGHYRARLPVGQYTLIAAKGIEYRTNKTSIHIEPRQTHQLTIDMKRWADLPSQGWYSGDIHIHMAQRNEADSRAILTKARAEDLHVANSLRMGNRSAVHFPHRAWGRDGWYGKGSYTVVPGQEDPRTNVRGHTIHLNIPEPARDPSRYLLYHEWFERVSKLGGISGYAHMNLRLGGSLFGNTGLALEVPYGLVDFVEVLQGGDLGTKVWFDFLNLGYRLQPAAGSDYPYIGHVGEVRTYVHLPNGYAADAWFENLAGGRVFVTNGPILDIQLNGSATDTEFSLSSGESISISARASINPDVDLLARLELIEQGDVVAKSISTAGAETLEFSYENPATHGTWFVVRAIGYTNSPTPIFGPDSQGNVIAMSAPFYVAVDGQRTWKKSAVAVLANERKAQLDTLAVTSAENAQTPERWQADPEWSEDWSRQLELLKPRIEAAKARYDALIDLAQ